MDVPIDELHRAKRNDAPKIFSDEKVQERHAERHKRDTLKAPITNCGPCWAFGSETQKFSLCHERRTESLKPLTSND